MGALIALEATVRKSTTITVDEYAHWGDYDGEDDGGGDGAALPMGPPRLKRDDTFLDAEQEELDALAEESERRRQRQALEEMAARLGVDPDALDEEDSMAVGPARASAVAERVAPLGAEASASLSASSRSATSPMRSKRKSLSKPERLQLATEAREEARLSRAHSASMRMSASQGLGATLPRVAEAEGPPAVRRDSSVLGSLTRVPSYLARESVAASTTVLGAIGSAVGMMLRPITGMMSGGGGRSSKVLPLAAADAGGGGGTAKSSAEKKQKTDKMSTKGMPKAPAAQKKAAAPQAATKKAAAPQAATKKTPAPVIGAGGKKQKG